MHAHHGLLPTGRRGRVGGPQRVGTGAAVCQHQYLGSGHDPRCAALWNRRVDAPVVDAMGVVDIPGHLCRWVRAARNDAFIARGHWTGRHPPSRQLRRDRACRRSLVHGRRQPDAVPSQGYR